MRLGRYLRASALVMAAHSVQLYALPNPAAKYCTEVGGTHEILPSTRKGSASISLCRLGGGLIGDWTFYRAAKLRESTVATEAFFRHDPYHGPGSTADPEMFYCEQVGGRVEEYRGPGGMHDYVHICFFSDESQIGVLPLFWGESSHWHYGDAIGEKLRNPL